MSVPSLPICFAVGSQFGEALVLAQRGGADSAACRHGTAQQPGRSRASRAAGWCWPMHWARRLRRTEIGVSGLRLSPASARLLDGQLETVQACEIRVLTAARGHASYNHRAGRVNGDGRVSFRNLERWPPRRPHGPCSRLPRQARRGLAHQSRLVRGTATTGATARVMPS